MPSDRAGGDRVAARAIGEPAGIFDMDKDKNRILIATSAADLARLTPWLEPVTLLPGEVLAEFEQPVTHVYFPQSAVLAIQNRTRDYGFVETCTVGREGAFGFVTVSGSGLSIGRVVVQIAGRSLRVRSDVFREILAASPGLQDLRTRYTEAALILMAQSIACKTLHSVEERLCRWLLTCRDRTGSDTIPLTQEALAESLGVQRTTITAAARNLQNRGLIRYRRGVIECVDPESLLRNSCECYGIVRSAFSRLLPYTYLDPPGTGRVGLG